MAPKINWRPDDPSLPLQQGDLLLVAWAKTVERQPEGAVGLYPTVGKRDALAVRFWDGNHPPLLEMWGCMSYGLTVVVADDCAIDKEFNILRDRYIAEGMERELVEEQANEQADPFVTVAEAWPVDELPEHLRRDAESGAVGYLPFSMTDLVPGDQRTYAVDLNRLSSVSWRAIDRRLGIRDERWRQRLQTQLFRFFAARTIRVNEELAAIFDRPVVRAEALTPPGGNPPRTRARLHFADGSSVTIEAILDNAVSQDEASTRPGLRTRS